MIHVEESGCQEFDILKLLHDSAPSYIALPDSFYCCTKNLREQLEQLFNVRKQGGLDS
jgi:hypothetical protein